MKGLFDLINQVLNTNLAYYFILQAIVMKKGLSIEIFILINRIMPSFKQNQSCLET